MNQKFYKFVSGIQFNPKESELNGRSGLADSLIRPRDFVWSLGHFVTEPD